MSAHSNCEHNCGGTGCPAPVKYVTYTAFNENCQHEWSFRVEVKFWIFSKIVEVCPDCQEVVK